MQNKVNKLQQLVMMCHGGGGEGIVEDWGGGGWVGVIAYLPYFFKKASLAAHNYVNVGETEHSHLAGPLISRRALQDGCKAGEGGRGRC